MKKRHTVGRIIVFALFTGCIFCGRLQAAEVEMNKSTEFTPIAWHEDFEQKDTVQAWATNGTYTINYKGLTTEKAHSGKKSFKLDVTFNSGSYFYWSVPVHIPAEGKLNFTGYMLLGKETTGSAGLGINLLFPPTEYSGCPIFESFHKTKGQWRKIKGDLVKRACETVDSIAIKYVALTRGDNLGRVIDRIGIFCKGRPGQRVVIYVDDLHVVGNGISNKNYGAIVKQRWQPVVERKAEAFAEFEQLIANSKSMANDTAGLSPAMQRIITFFAGHLDAMQKRLRTVGKQKYMMPNEFKEIKANCAFIAKSMKNIRELDAKGVTFKDAVLYGLDNPFITSKILPEMKFVPAPITTDLHIDACRGEYESVSMIVQALCNLDDLTLVADDFTNTAGGIIPKGAIDIRVVKSWYQAGSAWFGISQNRKQRKLVPELLVHDDSLVMVDTAKQINLLKLSFTNGPRYWYTEDPRYARGSGPSIISVDEVPIRDAPCLQPLRIKAGNNRQFWITLHVPVAAQSGNYSGAVQVLNKGEKLACMRLNLRVLPFTLPRPRTCHDLKREFISSVYYRGKCNAGRYPRGTISSEWKSKEQLRAELMDMWQHNIYNPTCYQGFEGIDTYLSLRNEVGMKGMPLFSLGVTTGNPENQAALDALQKKVERMKHIVTNYGVPELYIYGIDEAEGERLLSQRKAWEFVHKAGCKMFVAGKKGNFDKVGDLLDLQIQSGQPEAAQAAAWHDAGHRLFSYAYPQVGPEDPELFRRNFGLFLWQKNYDGAMTYAYQHSFGNIYDDFDHNTYREHVFSYPTVDGVIPTLAIEGYREAIDDIRYATVLKLLIIERNKVAQGDKDIAVKAATYLNNLDVKRDLTIIRHEIIDFILALMKPAQ